MYYTIGGFTLDDTVLPTGEIRWAAPGGNALYSAIGARLWGAQVGIISPVGNDYPDEYLSKLKNVGFDIQGICRIEYPSFHVWVLHEGNGRRQIIYRLDSGVNKSLDPVPENIPPQVGSAQGVHICPILGSSQGDLIEYLLPKGIPLFLDLIVIPNQIDVKQGHRQELWSRMRAFLPSIEEARALWGNLPVKQLMRELRRVGPAIVALKMGHHGCLVCNPEDGLIYHVPAYPSNVVDATGAGDSFCGGFMVGLQDSGDPLQAALQGTISASFVIEDFGALHALNVSAEQALDRLEYLRDRIKPLDDSGEVDALI